MAAFAFAFAFAAFVAAAGWLMILFINGARVHQATGGRLGGAAPSVSVQRARARTAATTVVGNKREARGEKPEGRSQPDGMARVGRRCVSEH